jgi:hypothetical protein
MTLSVADIEHWDAGSVRQVFNVAMSRAEATMNVSRELSTLKVFDTWGGAAADAAGHAFAQTRQDLDAHGREALAVANAANKAANDIEQVQADLRQLKIDAEAHGLEVDSASNRIVPMPHSTHGRREMQAAIPGLQARLDGIVAHGNAVDQELAGAINMADGDRPIPQSGPTAEPTPPVPGQPVDPANPFVGNSNFGSWEDVPVPPPYVGASPPPLKPEYRPLPDGTPLTQGGTTGFYTPGKTWVTDDQAPYGQLQEEYRFRMAGTEATTTTRMVQENGVWKQQRWVQNVYEYQRNTQLYFQGPVSVKGKEGDIDGLPPILNIDNQWKPISLPQVVSLSAANMDTTYYLPDGCGGQLQYVGGVLTNGIPPASSVPIMTAPRG